METTKQNTRFGIKFSTVEKQIRYQVATKSIFSFLLIGWIAALFSGSKQEPDTAMLEFAFASGNATFIAEHLSERSNLIIEDSEQAYSVAQAELVLASYFTKLKPLMITDVKKVSLSTDKFLLTGRLKTEDSEVRLSVYYTNNKGKPLVYKIKFG
ncbi:MAG: DUF4783 domain-containing protein [Luteibaculaceae bacterium]